MKTIMLAMVMAVGCGGATIVQDASEDAGTANAQTAVEDAADVIVAPDGGFYVFAVPVERQDAGVAPSACPGGGVDLDGFCVDLCVLTHTCDAGRD